MNHREDFPPPFKLGPWLVQPDLNRISGPEGDNQVEPRVMQVLLLLAKRPGEVWSRQALLEEIWKDSVVGEEILTRAISELRRIFGD
jgi:DNA-binding winged helix-turn-helix (wHTH) protein